MLMTLRMDVTEVKDDLMNMLDDLSGRILLAAADAGGEVIQNTYRAEMLRRATTPGSYKSAQGAIEQFIQAYESVARRTLPFKDGQGAYSVVGIATADGSWRMASPQAMWLEDGADGSSQPESRGERYRYSDDKGTGVEKAQHVLANIVDSTADIVTNTMQNLIIEQLEQYVT